MGNAYSPESSFKSGIGGFPYIPPLEQQSNNNDKIIVNFYFSRGTITSLNTFVLFVNNSISGNEVQEEKVWLRFMLRSRYYQYVICRNFHIVHIIQYVCFVPRRQMFYRYYDMIHCITILTYVPYCFSQSRNVIRGFCGRSTAGTPGVMQDRSGWTNGKST